MHGLVSPSTGFCDLHAPTGPVNQSLGLTIY
jgi:hypothetical protein